MKFNTKQGVENRWAELTDNFFPTLVNISSSNMSSNNVS